MKLIDGWWIDNNNNKWLAEWYSKKEAKELSKSLIDCKDCVGCSHCINCSKCIESHVCINCLECVDCFSCTICVACVNCHYCLISEKLSFKESHVNNQSL